MNDKNYYNILGISPSFENGDPELKKKYRELCHQYHPDKNSNNPVYEEKFKEISEAYSVLSDITKRHSYDLNTGFNPKVKKPSFEDDFWGNIFGASPFSSMDNFGRMFKRQIIQNIPYDLTFLDLFYGTSLIKEIQLSDGSRVKEKIVVEPRLLVQKRVVKDLPDGSTVILNFFPRVIKDTSMISEDAEEVDFDEKLNTVVIYKIPFITALRGGVINKNILKKEVVLEIPKSCENGHIIRRDDLSLSRTSSFIISFIYDLPDLPDSKIDQIESILST